MRPERVPVAREGVPFVGAAALAAVVLAQLGWQLPAVAALVVTAFVLYFFRDPERVVPAGQGLVVAPADGRVIQAGVEAADPVGGEPARRVSIFMNVFDVHVNRAPVAGEVEAVVYRPGAVWPADRPRALLRNECCALRLRTAEGDRVTAVQVAGLVAQRIVCRAEPGDRLARGERFGLIRFGSRVDVYLPPGYAVEVKKGQRVTAGQSVLARRAAG
ncbi:phosphatidylserine decarboxylase family protein [Dissulfurirhabdus thermomarina]|uniref:Phosphatidylserine decarboxylase proenzyme n=1 Tax=Dissulfurirhabdus thermomarina TaxID=1765737 RepID=A0A6N9TLN8_DISTH|nr:phosphatidylserine decarboxylase family protein [Dissulfurirhabdus thermomarina]NDY41340.1 phosphatidylserine decarboxylase family protein [Dissulfurirhabdus thermomarina]NMX23277.1 phosphatidylserine decarboxylase family protein [Dissulfurirhabdus thermomarina]